MNTILAVINSWPQAEKILGKARQIAGSLNGELIVYCPVINDLEEMNRYIGFDNYEEVRDQIVADALSRLEALPGIDSLEYEVEWQPKPYRAVADKAEELAASLIVLAVSEHSVIGDFIHKPDDWHLLRDARCPVLILGDKDRPYKSVAVAIDVLDTSDDHQSLTGRLLDEGRMMADLLKLPLDIISVVPDPAYVYNSLSAGESTVMADFREQARLLAEQRQAETVERFGVRVQSAAVKVGPVARTLQEALTESGLLVIGTIANKGLKGFFLGNTAERLLQHLDGDMLVVN